MHILTKTTWIPATLDQAWEFFSSPDNLALITPKELNFEILDRSDSHQMFAGQIIQYKVSIYPFLRVRWVTEITHVENQMFFVDEQRFGPYSFWHHKHFFYPEDGGVRMVDIVHYKLPLGFLGRMIEPFLVAPKLEKIFSFREEVIKKMFHK